MQYVIPHRKAHLARHVQLRRSPKRPPNPTGPDRGLQEKEGALFALFSTPPLLLCLQLIPLRSSQTIPLSHQFGIIVEPRFPTSARVSPHFLNFSFFSPSVSWCLPSHIIPSLPSLFVVSWFALTGISNEGAGRTNLPHIISLGGTPSSLTGETSSAHPPLLFFFSSFTIPQSRL